tara:strand:+ start:4504 stop:5205 length:702 start_codon:yes stop_codon:yes gene_type:complete
MPTVMVSAAMIGFGSLARESGLSLDVTLALTIGLWGLPGQVAMAEMWALSAPVLAIVAASSMGNMRFLPMALITAPWFHGDNRPRWTRYLAAQVMSVNVWSIFVQNAANLAIGQRYPYFMGIGTICVFSGILATILGFFLAGTLPVSVTIALIFLNPAYFLFVFSSVRQRNCMIAVILGFFLGPLLHQSIPDWSVPLTGIIAGTTAFLLDETNLLSKIFQNPAKKRGKNDGTT